MIYICSTLYDTYVYQNIYNIDIIDVYINIYIYIYINIYIHIYVERYIYIVLY